MAGRSYRGSLKNDFTAPQSRCWGQYWVMVVSVKPPESQLNVSNIKKTNVQWSRVGKVGWQYGKFLRACNYQICMIHKITIPILSLKNPVNPYFIPTFSLRISLNKYLLVESGRPAMADFVLLVNSNSTIITPYSLLWQSTYATFNIYIYLEMHNLVIDSYKLSEKLSSWNTYFVYHLVQGPI